MKGTSRFCKSERIVSKKQVEELFSGQGSSSRVAFPLRAVYVVKPREGSTPAARLLIRVPKRRFRHAVDRNRVKRQLREAYRLNKRLLTDSIPAGSTVSIAFIWISDKHLPTDTVTQRVKGLLDTIARDVCQRGDSHLA